jgi:hypothetical protein
MKTKMKTFALALLTILSVTSTAVNAQDNSAQQKTTVSIETDPSTFAFGGYAFHFRIKPKNSEHLVIGAGTYAMDYPSFLVDMNPDNKGKDWNVRIKSAYGLFGEYYFKEANSKWFAGLQIGMQNYKIKNDKLSGLDNEYTNLLLMPSLGYTWTPFKIPFYIKPWLGIGYTTKMSGDNKIGTSTYSISPIVPFLTLHVGYTF